MAALGSGGLVVIDEIQRTPSLLNSVQAILDEDDRFRFILTGSSARKLKRGGANLLPGRIILEYLDPLSYWEMKEVFDLDRVLRVGSLPGIYLDQKSGEEVLGTYATVYLREEIQAEAVIKNIGAYARFLDVAAEMSGQWINYSKVASDTEIAKETIRRFFTLLEDTLLAHRIPAFRPKQSKRRVSQRDRFIFFDIGVRNALLGIHKGKISPTEEGHLFEQWIVLQCLSFIRMYHKEWKISAYRTDAGAEVDCILDLGDAYVAIECKTGKKVTESQLKGLRSFEEIAKKPVQKIIVYCGENREKFSQGELAIPYLDFLNNFIPSC
ncbi:MAG: ATP-binding protein [Deltaproteobacteria bacterium]|nr:ATP-binding protein [Deltaproteobacteria bacterium]